jgi:LacI family transcriptional regulator
VSVTKRRVPISRVPKVALLLETSTEYGRGLLRGIVRYSRLHGPWSLYLAPGHLEQTLPKAQSWDGDGIIGRIRTRQTARAVLSTGLPFVASSLIEWSPRGHYPGFCEILTNSTSIAELAASHLLERGLRYFAFCGFVDCAWSTLREKVFAAFLTNKGFHSEARRIHLSNWITRSNSLQSWEHEQPVLSKWLQALPKPVGVMACNDACGRAVLEACAAAQLHVPDDVAVVGVDNDELLCELSTPPLSSVALNIEAAGYEAARLLDGLMSGRVRGRHVVRVEPVFVQTRRSTDVIAQEDMMLIKALRFIRDHAAKPVSVSDVVEGVATSRRTLERRFLQGVGCSILAEITRCRIERAKRLLVETRLSCLQVSREAGFSSVKSFNRAFRRAERTTPKIFRYGT